MKIKQALIFAGGLRTRLGEKSRNFPKPVQDIDNEPFLNNILWNLKRYDINEVILLVSYLSENFRNYYKNADSFGLNISYFNEEIPAGTGGALKLCAEQYKLDDYFLLINGDTLFDINYHDLAKNFLEKEIGHLALKYVNDVSRYREVISENGKIISFKEKGAKKSGYINGGVGIFNKKVIDFINSIPSSLEKDIFPKLIKNKLLSAQKLNSFFLDIGLPESLRAARQIIPNWRSKFALILDRDGVINIDFGYVHSMRNFQWVDYAKETIKLANDLGFLVIVVTNQSGIARGFYSEKIFKDFSSEINNQLIEYGAHIDATYFCPHHPKEGIGILKKDCDCRKPKPGMIKKALSDWNLNSTKCFLIGDKESDIKAAKMCNIDSFLFSSKTDNLLNIFKNKFANIINQKINYN